MLANFKALLQTFSGCVHILVADEDELGVYDLSLAEGLEILLQSEKEEREIRRFERLKSNAKFRYQASMEEINFEASRGLAKDLFTKLATCNFIDKGESVLITGATGCGKSFIASALGHQACVHGKTVDRISNY